MRNYNKTILVAGFLASAFAAKAQSVEYKIIENDPGSYKHTMLYLDLFTADTYLNACIGSNIKLETMVGERLMPWAQVKFSWLDASTSHVVTGFPTNAGGQKKQRVADLGAAWFFASKNKNKNVKVVLSKSSSGGYTTTRYLRIPGTVKKMFGPEGGLYINRRALEFDEKSHNLYRYESTDGHTNVPIENVGVSSGVAQPSGESYKPLSMTHIFSIYGGLHYRTITNMTISAHGDGTRSNRSSYDLYADVMFAPAVSVANVIDNSGHEWKIVPQDGAIRHLGWKAGITHHNCSKVSFEYNFEFGKKPGPVMGKGFMDNGSYIALGMGLTIGSNKYFKLSGKKTTTKSSDDAKPAN